jgi:choline dehydrogenase-like flavoprotein
LTGERETRALRKFSDKVNACVIGSGAGGGVVAKKLADAGLTVVVIEAGKRFDPLRDYTSARADWELAGKESVKKDFSVPALHNVELTNPNSVRPVEVNGVGGGTLFYLAYAVRMRPDDFKVHSLDGVAMDWPITYEDLVPYYRKVELELGVSGLAGDPWTPQVEPYPNPAFENSYANKIMKRGFDKLGLRLWPTPMARLSRPFDDRPMCNQCGNCDHGCITGAKSGTDVTFLRKAEASGRVEIRPQAVATQIRLDASGKAKGVLYFDRFGTEQEQLADVVVVSAGSIQSPRLLLNSKSNLFPDGLSNSSGLVGKYFAQHITVRSAACFADRIDSFRGFFGGATSQDLSSTAPKNNFVRGWCHELHSGISKPAEMALLTSAWGDDLKRHMRKYFGHIAGVTTVGEQLTDEKNCVELHPERKDSYGMPIARVSLHLTSNDAEMIKAMKKNIYDIYAAAGAAEILKLEHRTGASPHNYGTCRMGRDPKQSVVNNFCQSHDVSNLFVIDASCFVSVGTANPALTIQAIATRASEYIAKQGKNGNI